MTLDAEAGRGETAFEEEADDDDTTVGCATLVLLTDPGAGTLPLPGQFWPCLYTKPACVRPIARRQTVHKLFSGRCATDTGFKYLVA